MPVGVTLYKYAMSVWVTWRNVSAREDGFPEGGARGNTILPRGDIPSCYPHWHGIFVLLYRTNPVCNCKQSKVTDDWWFTHSPLGVASGNGQHEALTDGIRQHDDCSLLSQPITANDLKVRYNKIECLPSGGWFSLGLRPRENNPPSGKHSIMLPPLAWHICIMYIILSHSPSYVRNQDYLLKCEHDWVNHFSVAYHIHYTCCAPL